jgi:putative endonuclease
MHYVYVLLSDKDFRFYIGCTYDLREHLKLHQAGQVESTKLRLPVTLIYYEACKSERDAFRREKYLKTTYGHRYLRSRLRDYFTG